MNGLTLEQANDRSYGMRMHEGLRVVAVANSPRMMREALERALEGVPGILVVDLGGEPERAEELSRQIQVNWLVVTLEHGASMSRRIRRLLHRVPSLAILALSPDGDRVEMLVERGGQLRRFTYWGVRLTSLIAILRYMDSGEEIAYPPFPQLESMESQAAMTDHREPLS